MLAGRPPGRYRRGVAVVDADRAGHGAGRGSSGVPAAASGRMDGRGRAADQDARPDAEERTEAQAVELRTSHDLAPDAPIRSWAIGAGRARAGVDGFRSGPSRPAAALVPRCTLRAADGGSTCPFRGRLLGSSPVRG